MPDPHTDYSAPSTHQRPEESRRPARFVWPWLLVALLLALLLGLLASPWAEQRLRAQLPVGLQDAPAVAADPRVDQLEARVARLEQAPPALAAPAVTAGPAAALKPLGDRVAALESQAGSLVAADSGMSSRLEQLAQDIQRVGGSAQAADMQVRELFVLSVARRLVAAGRALSPLSDVLERSYGQQYPPAMQALTAWSANPHNRATLATRLDELPVEETPRATAGNWWDRLRSRLSGLVSVRGERTSSQPGVAELQREAQAEMARGDLAAAIRAVERQPPSKSRDAWLADAQLLLGAEQALDMLEESAIGRTIDIAAATSPPGGPAPVNAPEALAPAQ